MLKTVIRRQDFHDLKEKDVFSGQHVEATNQLSNVAHEGEGKPRRSEETAEDDGESIHRHLRRKRVMLSKLSAVPAVA